MTIKNLYLGESVLLEYDEAKETHTLVGVDREGNAGNIKGEEFDSRDYVSITLTSLIENEEGYTLQNVVTLPTSFIERGIDPAKYLGHSIEQIRSFKITPIYPILRFRAGAEIDKKEVVDIHDLLRTMYKSLDEEYKDYLKVSNMIFNRMLDVYQGDLIEISHKEKEEPMQSLLKQMIAEVEHKELEYAYMIKENREGKDAITLRMVNTEGIFVDLVKEGNKEYCDVPSILETNQTSSAIFTIYYIASLISRDIDQVFKEVPNPLLYLDFGKE